MTYKNLVSGIAGQLVGVNYGDLTKLERNIYRLLKLAGWLRVDNNNDIVRIKV